VLTVVNLVMSLLVFRRCCFLTRLKLPNLPTGCVNLVDGCLVIMLLVCKWVNLFVEVLYNYLVVVIQPIPFSLEFF